MSPTQLEAKREDKCPPPLKINKASHFVKKSPSSSSFSSLSPSSTSISSNVNGVSNSVRPSQRQPVIIYAHSPKVIHTNPRDFMALVQKLIGLPRSDNNSFLLPSTLESVIQTDKKKVIISGGGGDDNESSSSVTEENWYCLGNNGCVDSSNQSYFNYRDYMLLSSFNTRNSSTFVEPNMNQLH